MLHFRLRALRTIDTRIQDVSCLLTSPVIVVSNFEH